jgi:hypothetical protein
LSLFLPALLAAADAAAQDPALPSKTYKFEDLPVRGTGPKSRAILDGKTHTGYPLEIHATELAAGQAPHPAHHHVHEEMFLVREGTVEVIINGKTTQLGRAASPTSIPTKSTASRTPERPLPTTS